MTEEEFAQYLAAQGVVSPPEAASREAAKHGFDDYEPNARSRTPKVTFDSDVFIRRKPRKLPGGFYLSAVVVEELAAGAEDGSMLKELEAALRNYDQSGRLLVPTGEDWPEPAESSMRSGKGRSRRSVHQEDRYPGSYGGRKLQGYGRSRYPCYQGRKCTGY